MNLGFKLLPLAAVAVLLPIATIQQSHRPDSPSAYIYGSVQFPNRTDGFVLARKNDKPYLLGEMITPRATQVAKM